MKLRFYKHWFLFALILSIAIATSLAYENPPESQEDIGFYSCPIDTSPLPFNYKKKVKNIIFLIGDGMGVSNVDAARIKACGADGRLNMERMPVCGLMKTHSESHLVTDSAAAGTALATGKKSYNGAISVDPKKKPLLSILEAAAKKGLKTGLVVTCTMSHATPAVFASHVESRNDQAEIAPQLIQNRVNILMGGGKEYFVPKSFEGSKRKDERNLLREAEKIGYRILETKDDLDRAKGDLVLGLFQMGALETVSPEPSLPEMTLKAINLLKENKKGFFLMVEGSQIDWANHANDPDYSIRQTLLFDQAVFVALDFALKDKKTLVLVTADHETGGLAVNQGKLNGEDLEIGWTTKHHSASQVPIYAFGPGSLLFTGVLDNTQVPCKFAELLKIKDFPCKK